MPIARIPCLIQLWGGVSAKRATRSYKGCVDNLANLSLAAGVSSKNLNDSDSTIFSIVLDIQQLDKKHADFLLSYA